MKTETKRTFEIRWTGTMYSDHREVPIVPIRYSDEDVARSDYRDMLRLIPKNSLGDHTLTAGAVDLLSHKVEEIAYDGIVESAELHEVITIKVETKLEGSKRG